MSKKVTIREWLYTQHMPPDVREDVEKLFALPKAFRQVVYVTVGIGNHESMRPLNEIERNVCRICADELEGILGQ